MPTSHTASPAELHALAASLQRHRVPSTLAVPLLLHMAGGTVVGLAREVGVTRGYLNHIFAGRRVLTERVRDGLIAKLGFDPLAIGETAGTDDLFER